MKHRINTAAVIAALVLIGSVSPAAAKGAKGENGVRHITDELVDKVESLEVTTEALEAQTDALQSDVESLEVTTEALESQTDALESEIDVLSGRERAEIPVDCGAGELLQDAIDAAGPNTTIRVEGECRENIIIGPSNRGMTIDGQDSASIVAASGTTIPDSAIHITGTDITIRNFGVSPNSMGSINGGGRGIVVTNSASARIRDNIIQEADGAGIAVEGNSSAKILGNVIRRHGGNGIAVARGSTAEIGTRASSSACLLNNLNIISDNGANGIAISEGSEATIRENAIRGNTTNGIFVADGSVADTASNDISDNGGDGVDVRRASSVRMGRRDIPDSACARGGVLDCLCAPNRTDGDNNNVGVGIDCDSLSTVDGRLGTLNGDMGASMLRNTNADCPGCCFTSLEP